MTKPARGWRPALRIARRQIRRNVSRSLLIATLVGLPVAGATLVDVLYRTTESPDRTADRLMGDADAILEITAYGSLDGIDDQVPYFPNTYYGTLPSGKPVRDPRHVDPATVLPAGSVTVPVLLHYDARVEAGDAAARTWIDVAPLGQPMTDQWARLESGHWPEAPDEVVVTRALAERLDLVDDDGELNPQVTVALDEGPTARVSGIVLVPFDLEGERVVALPGSAVARHATQELDAPWDEITHTGGSGYLVDLPDGVDVEALWPVLAEQGIRLVPRDAVIDPDRHAPPELAQLYGSPLLSAQNLQAAGLVALVVGIGLLEVVLLAGAAFAVGARRQVRELGLMAAGGATASQIRRTVLAQGLALGALGSAMGIVAGAALAIAGRPLWEGLLNELIDTWRFGPLEIALAAAVGLVSGLAAAIVPAVGAARMKPVDALAQRFRTSRLAARMPVLGIAMFVVGAGGALVVSRMMADDLAGYAEQLTAAADTGLYVNTPNTFPYVSAQLAGAIVATAGLVITLPGLVSALARRAHRLGLSVRLAVRDAARHRHRTAPAIAAITIVVAGATAVAFGIGGVERADELRYVPALPADVMRVDVDQSQADPSEGAATLAAASDAAVKALPSALVHEAAEPMVDHSLEGDAPSFGPLWVNIPPCSNCTEEVGVTGSVSLGIGDPDIIALAAGGAPDDQLLDALTSGHVVVFDDVFVDDGTVTIEQPTDNGEFAQVRLPAYLAERDLAYTSLPAAFVSEQTAVAQGWTVRQSYSLVTFDGATPEQLDAALDAAEVAGAWPQIESSPTDGVEPAVLALTAAAAFVTFVGVAVAVSLAAVEGRADLATLAAVGAPPRRRRSLAAAQALLVGGLGVMLGVGLGVYFAYLVWPALGAPDFIWAWDSLALIGVAVPTLAVLVAVVATPSRLPMVRRAE